eukprot:Gregarina_sp_Poly_1__1009@NODE_1246_length_4639_cov_204_610236_g849_i0_p3_GENE_NODE_1246_length_4639_cov_204_610236_g849_i0NODE_1246_length_4639_cov_204_610236_g849_i0_p3_ORF_typecomplete_len133_score18_03DUF5572/PF17733_1/0_1DUF5572/PF17733_1/8_3e02_NODE_1246_length_4639_cov_204_610236_g849_i037844182
MSFCFNSPSEVETFKKLKNLNVLVNWQYAAMGGQPAPILESEARRQIVEKETSLPLPRKDFYSFGAMYESELKDGLDMFLRARRGNFIPGVDEIPERLDRKSPQLNPHYLAQRRKQVPETLSSRISTPSNQL